MVKKMEKRETKNTDEQEIEKGFILIMELIQKHPEIEPSLWVSCVWSILVAAYKHSGFSYEEFTKDVNKVKRHYKSWFNK